MKARIVAVLLSCSFAYCRGRHFIGGRTTQQATDRFAAAKEEGTVALIGAGAGVAVATLLCQSIPSMKRNLLRRQYQLELQHQRQLECHRYRARQAASKQRRDTTVTFFALTSFGAAIFVKEEFRKQFLQRLSSANSNIIIPFGKWVKNTLSPLLGRLGTFLLVGLEWTTVNVGGPITKTVATVGLVVLAVALLVVIVIAKPTLQEIVQDLRDEVHQSYRGYKRKQRYEQGYAIAKPTLLEIVQDLRDEVHQIYRSYKRKQRCEQGY